MKMKYLLTVVATATSLIFASVAAGAGQKYTEIGTGIEGAIVSLNINKKGVGHASVRECDTCRSKRLKVTRSTQAFLGDQPVHITELGNLGNRLVFVFWRFDSDELEHIRVSDN